MLKFLKTTPALLLASLAVIMIAIPFKGTVAQEGAADIQEVLQRLGPLEQLIKNQQKLLDEQGRKLAMQEEELNAYKKKLNSLAMAESSDKASQKDAKPAKASAKEGAPEKPVVVASQSTVVQGTSIVPPASAKKEERPEINVLPDAGGVLTPKGKLMYENTMQYTNTTSNIFSFDGVQVSEVVFIGSVATSSARRNVLQNASRFRLGIWDRLEADVRVPYVYRNDASSTTAIGGGTSRTTVEGHGIGDVDAGLAYQINKGAQGWPFFVANLRYKSNTGEGPFDVPYDANNIAERLPTGTGFNSVEGSLTTIKVTDPAVLFANIGYVHSFGDDINKTFNNTRVLKVSPGNVFNASGGMGFSINQDTSFTLGYKHSYVMPTYQTAQNTGDLSIVKTRSDSLNVGALLVGASYRLTPKISLNLTTEVGATRDAPDVQVGLRIPIELTTLY